MISKFLAILLILAVLFISPNLITLAKNPNLGQDNNSKLTQINIINFENSIGIAQIDRYLQENKLTNLKSVSLMSNIQIGNYILFLPLEYDVNIDTSSTKNVEKYKTIKTNLIKELEKVKIANKENKQNPNQTKFNRNDILKIIKKSDNKKEEIQSNKLLEGKLLPEEIKTNESGLIFFEENGYLPPIEVNEIKNKIKELNLPQN